MSYTPDPRPRDWSSPPGAGVYTPSPRENDWTPSACPYCGGPRTWRPIRIGTEDSLGIGQIEPCPECKR